MILYDGIYTYTHIMSPKSLLRKIISVGIIITLFSTQIIGSYAINEDMMNEDSLISQEAARYAFHTPGLMLLSAFQEFTLTGSIVEFLQMPAFLTE